MAADDSLDWDHLNVQGDLGGQAWRLRMPVKACHQPSQSFYFCPTEARSEPRRAYLDHQLAHNLVGPVRMTVLWVCLCQEMEVLDCLDVQTGYLVYQAEIVGRGLHGRLLVLFPADQMECQYYQALG